jgi:hypothetical protein
VDPQILSTAGFMAPVLVAAGWLLAQMRADRKQYAQLVADAEERHEKEQARTRRERDDARAAHEAERSLRIAAEDRETTQRRRAEAAEAALLLAQGGQRDRT